MALIDCPECKKLASDRAPACPHCGYPVAVLPEAPRNPWKNEQPTTGAGAAAGGLSPGGQVTLLLFGAFVLVVIASMLGLGADRSTERAPKGHDDRQGEAVVFCEGRVRARLKAPSTADFPWSASAQAVGNQTYVVSSYVEAQNSFGAQLRTPYVCRARYDGDDWTLVALNMG